MRLDIHSTNRLGITQEVLEVFARHKVDVRAVDMVTHHIYVDAPAIRPELLDMVNADLLKIPGIDASEPTNMLPSERRRAQLHAVLSAMIDPVLAVDLEGTILLANKSAGELLGALDKETLRGARLRDYLGVPLVRRILAAGFNVQNLEVQVKGDAFLLYSSSFGLKQENATTPEGGVLVLQSRARLGGIMTSLQVRDGEGFDAILGESEIIKQTKARAASLAVISAPLLIMGETGTGKELFARACHQTSPRAPKPFLALNCAAIPETLAESELFGHEGGAFTNASKAGKPGLFELADGGTVFLDEIGEMSLYLQAKLLRFMEDGSFRRIGGRKEKKVDVRIISATNRNLPLLAERDQFRADLLFRMNVLNIQTPPLRDHSEDIPKLAHYFANRSAVRIGRKRAKLSDCAIARLIAAQWPGNVRELENVIFRSVSLHDGDLVTSQELVFDDGQISQVASPDTPNHKIYDYQTAFEAFEERFFKEAAKSGEPTRLLASKLNLSHSTIARKIKKYTTTQK